MSSSSNLPDESNLLRLAISGCGRMGRLHAERVLQDGRARVVAVVDADRETAEALAAGTADGAVVYDSIESLIEKAEIDAAVICTPTATHFDQAVPLLSRGIPVLCEKPLAANRNDLIELITTARTGNAVLTVAYQRRLLAIYRTLREAVLSGAFGSVRAVLSHNIENWQQTIGGTWRDDPVSNPGGFIGDAGSHKIDAVFYVTGLDPSEVFARCDTWGSQVEVTATVSALLAGNVPLTMDFIGNARQFSELLSIHCKEADLLLRDGELWVSRGDRWEPLAITGEDSNPMTGFLDVLIDDADNFAPPDCALPVFDFTAAVLESSRTGRSVKIGPHPTSANSQSSS